MDLGTSVAKAIYSVIKVIAKPCLILGHALGMEWMMILYWIPFSLFGRSDKTWYMVAMICTILKFAFNIF